MKNQAHITPKPTFFDAIVNRKRAIYIMLRKLTLSGQLSKQLIHDMDHSNAQNIRSV